jgi:FtsH-binding integral membrane protein
MSLILKHRVALVHLVFVAPFLAYVALKQPTQPWVYWLLMALGVLVFIRFSVEAIHKRPISIRHIYYVGHALVFAPLLMYVAVLGTNTPQPVFTTLLAVAIAAFAYHGAKLIQRVALVSS